LLLLANPALGFAFEDEEPDLEALAETGQATLEQFQRQAATWTTATRIPNGGQGVVEVVRSPTMRRSRIWIEAQGRRFEMLEIIERDGFWYAKEGKAAGKYRPWEVPCAWPSAYFFLVRADPIVVTEAEVLAQHVYETTEDGIATYRSSLNEPARRMIQNTVDEIERLKRADPTFLDDPDMARTYRQSRDLLKNGIPLRIDLETGLIVQMGAIQKRTIIREFRWLDRAPRGTFEIAGVKWEDHSIDPTEGDRNDLVMLSHNGLWRVGQEAGDTDGRLLDLRTGQVRRIPYQGALSLPGCFLRDRRRVVVSGHDVIEGTLGLYEIDLKTGANRRLGGALLAGGITVMPALSPDGQTLAVLQKGMTERMLDAQLCLVDLATGEARPLGEPRDMAFLSWLPDGDGLLLLSREPVDPADPFGPRTEMITRMDLEGRVTTIREGDSPVLLEDGQRILFRDNENELWKTCDLDGDRVQLYADGLRGYGMPSPAPDGERLIMMHFSEGQPPAPTILPIGQSEGTPAITAPGLWTMPSWR